MLGFLKNLFRKRKRTQIYLTLAGKLYTGFTLLVAFAAVNTGNNILYIILSFLLSLMVVSGILSVYNLKGLKVEISPPDEVWCCKENPFKVFITNRKRLPSFLIDLILENVKKHLTFVERKVSEEIGLRFEKRGKHLLKEAFLESSFPFGLITRRKKVELNKEIIVFPRPKELEIHLQPFKGNIARQGDFLTVKMERGQSVEGIKEYEGEGRRLIHWKIFARLGELYAKKLSSENPLGEVVINLDKVPGKDWEEKISHATYLVLKFYRSGFAVGIKHGVKEIKPSYGREHLRKLLEFLAIV
jgi:uncharacterized protein (DUF58 family)